MTSSWIQPVPGDLVVFDFKLYQLLLHQSQYQLSAKKDKTINKKHASKPDGYEKLYILGG